MVEKIQELKKQRDAVILAHYYQMAEIQQVADFVGDSFELSRRAKEAPERTIVFCGVWFMAESAKILSPDKTVLIPRRDAGCPMADMVRPEDVRRLRAQHPGAAVVTYINSSADVKAESDICCTSSNAIRIVNALPQDEIIFIPDRNLGRYVARFTDKKMIFFNGFCPTHNRVLLEDVQKARTLYPDAEVLVHPECTPEVIDAADYVGSTSQIIDHATQSDRQEFIIGTEEGVLHPLRTKNPGKQFHILTEHFVCPNMKKTALEDLLDCLETGRHEVELDGQTIQNARESLSKMLSI